MKHLYLVKYQIVTDQSDLWPREDLEKFTVPVFATDDSEAVYKLKKHLENKNEINKKTGRKLNILSVVKEIK